MKMPFLKNQFTQKIFRKVHRGFTLLEALFAMVVIVIGLTAVMTLFQDGLSHLTQASTRMQAALLASNFFEELKSYGFNNLPAVPVSGLVNDMAAANAGRISPFPAPFTGTVAMDTLAAEDLDGDGQGDYNNKAGASMIRQYTLTISAGMKFKAVTMRMRIAQ